MAGVARQHSIHPSNTAAPYTSHLQTSADPGPQTTTSLARARPSKRLAPGLQLRLKRLEEQNRKCEAEAQRKHSIGRIPEEQLAELEKLQRERAAIDVQRLGRAWAGPPARVDMPAGGVRLSGGPVLTDNEASMFESDVSSVIDISDHFVASETEDEFQDRQKYRLPDIGKTRLHLRTKEPLSPGPRPVERRRENSSPVPPATPKTAESTTNGSPGIMDSPSIWHARNGSVVSLETPVDTDFARPSLSRAGSIYTLGRASFTGQLAQLTNMRLPDADSLAKKISSMSTAIEAARALSDASESIMRWISKASDVLEGLNAEDDVEWAAAGGREGIEEVDQAINRFQRLVEIYIESIERLQIRDDISLLSAEEIKGSVGQMEAIIASWKNIKDTLKGVKDQVEIAMEWEEIWNTVLGEIAQEMEGLNRLVFEMEEQRHQGAESLLSSKDTIDLTELETIVEEQPGRGKMMGNTPRSLVQPFSTTSPVQNPPSNTPIDKEDSSLLALFARMQPLRAALDFLPMRLSVWTIRGKPTFPSACIDLDQRREQLEAQWTKLEGDAESLRRELGEDRWVMVFRNAGKQALKMCESITRSFKKLKDAVEADEAQSNFTAFATKVENYEQKKRHYGPAIGRVLAIIDRGVADRLTVNGEVLRLQSDMKGMWSSLQAEMSDMDAAVESINIERQEKNLRDSVSTVISSERSIASSFLDTPGSSPASSVIGGSRKGSFGSRTPTPLTTIKTRSSTTQLPKSRLPSASKSASRRSSSLLPRSSLGERLASSSPKSPASSIPTPSKQPAWPSRPEPQLGNKPRWIQMAKAESRDYRPLAAYEPSPYAKTPSTPKHNYLRATSKAADGTATPSIPRTPGLRITSAPTTGPPSSLPRPASVLATSRKSSLPVPSATPSRRPPELSSKASAPALRPASGRRSSLLSAPPTDGNEADNESPSHHKRSPSALSGRRSSMLPSRPRSRLGELASSVGVDGKPKWRP